ncbi:phosphatase PAP2 family protein, partial [Roseibium sp. RKSG952]|uniref:phosphatase PAP2 family protein n=1 Tax=Roseibium sp. RKSG952 TaxID=2529384 RepID=UPI0012BBB95A
PDNAGIDPFPLEYIINPYQNPAKPLLWTSLDWDPALRYWSIEHDPHLSEFQASANPDAPATFAAREFGVQFEKWHPKHIDYTGFNWLEPNDLIWWPGDPKTVNPGDRAGGIDPAKLKTAWDTIRSELELLKIYMEDDREKYLTEAERQADGQTLYYVHFIGADAIRHPWTMALIECGLAIGHVAYLGYKAHFRRVRPSVLRPGLTPPFGPPAHPSFPSGHSFLAHFIALFLLKIPGLYQRFGVSRAKKRHLDDGVFLDRPQWSDLSGEAAINSPLLRVAGRVAVNRERIGLHYPSDSFAGRHLAAGIWDALMPDERKNTNYDKGPIDCPTLEIVLDRAKAEWPVYPEAAEGSEGDQTGYNPNDH